MWFFETPFTLDRGVIFFDVSQTSRCWASLNLRPKHFGCANCIEKRWENHVIFGSRDFLNVSQWMGQTLRDWESLRFQESLSISESLAQIVWMRQPHWETLRKWQSLGVQRFSQGFSMPGAFRFLGLSSQITQYFSTSGPETFRMCHLHWETLRKWQDLGVLRVSQCFSMPDTFRFLGLSSWITQHFSTSGPETPDVPIALRNIEKITESWPTEAKADSHKQTTGTYQITKVLATSYTHTQRSNSSRVCLQDSQDQPKWRNRRRNGWITSKLEEKYHSWGYFSPIKQPQKKQCYMISREAKTTSEYFHPFFCFFLFLFVVLFFRFSFSPHPIELCISSNTPPSMWYLEGQLWLESISHTVSKYQQCLLRLIHLLSQSWP